MRKQELTIVVPYRIAWSFRSWSVFRGGKAWAAFLRVQQLVRRLAGNVAYWGRWYPPQRLARSQGAMSKFEFCSRYITCRNYETLH